MKRTDLFNQSFIMPIFPENYSSDVNLFSVYNILVLTIGHRENFKTE